MPRCKERHCPGRQESTLQPKMNTCDIHVDNHCRMIQTTRHCKNHSCTQQTTEWRCKDCGQQRNTRHQQTKPRPNQETRSHIPRNKENERLKNSHTTANKMKQQITQSRARLTYRQLDEICWPPGCQDGCRTTKPAYHKEEASHKKYANKRTRTSVNTSLTP